MTNTKKLQGHMKENGYTIDSLANSLKLSATGLFNKIHNKSEFLASEIMTISEMLRLSLDDIQLIFFDDNVDLKSTKED